MVGWREEYKAERARNSVQSEVWWRQLQSEAHACSQRTKSEETVRGQDRPFGLSIGRSKRNLYWLAALLL